MGCRLPAFQKKTMWTSFLQCAGQYIVFLSVCPCPSFCHRVEFIYVEYGSGLKCCSLFLLSLVITSFLSLRHRCTTERWHLRTRTAGFPTSAASLPHPPRPDGYRKVTRKDDQCVFSAHQCYVVVFGFCFSRTIKKKSVFSNLLTHWWFCAALKMNQRMCGPTEQPDSSGKKSLWPVNTKLGPSFINYSVINKGLIRCSI